MSVKNPDGSRLKLDDPELDPVWDKARRAEDSGVHPHRRAAGVLRAARLPQRAMAGARAVPGSAPPGRRALRGADGRTRPHGQEAPEDDVHPGAHGMARERPGAAGEDVRRESERVLPRSARSSTTSAASRGSRASSSSSTRTASCSARTASSRTNIPYYWRVFETADEYFDYYRDYHAFWKLYGIDLPDEVLKKLYYKNALKNRSRNAQGRFPELSRS